MSKDETGIWNFSLFIIPMLRENSFTDIINMKFPRKFAVDYYSKKFNVRNFF